MPERKREKETRGMNVDPDAHVHRMLDAERTEIRRYTRQTGRKHTFLGCTWIEHSGDVSKFNRNQRDEVYWSVRGNSGELRWFLAVGKCFVPRIDRFIWPYHRGIAISPWFTSRDDSCSLPYRFALPARRVAKLSVNRFPVKLRPRPPSIGKHCIQAKSWLWRPVFCFFPGFPVTFWDLWTSCREIVDNREKLEVILSILSLYNHLIVNLYWHLKASECQRRVFLIS